MPGVLPSSWRLISGQLCPVFIRVRCGEPAHRLQHARHAAVVGREQVRWLALAVSQKLQLNIHTVRKKLGKLGIK